METIETKGNEKKFLLICGGIAAIAFAILCLELTVICIIASMTI